MSTVDETDPDPEHVQYIDTEEVAEAEQHEEEQLQRLQQVQHQEESSYPSLAYELAPLLFYRPARA